MQVKLIGDKLLVEVDSKETKTASGLIVARTLETGGVKTGKVVAAGLGKLTDQGTESTPVRLPMTAKVGDTVMFHYGLEVNLEGKPYTIVSESDEVLMVL